MDKVTAAEELIDKTLNEVISNEANQNVYDSEKEDGESYSLYWILQLFFFSKNLSVYLNFVLAPRQPRQQIIRALPDIPCIAVDLGLFIVKKNHPE